MSFCSSFSHGLLTRKPLEMIFCYYYCFLPLQQRRTLMKVLLSSDVSSHVFFHVEVGRSLFLYLSHMLSGHQSINQANKQASKLVFHRVLNKNNCFIYFTQTLQVFSIQYSHKVVVNSATAWNKSHNDIQGFVQTPLQVFSVSTINSIRILQDASICYITSDQYFRIRDERDIWQHLHWNLFERKPVSINDF